MIRTKDERVALLANKLVMLLAWEEGLDPEVDGMRQIAALSMVLAGVFVGPNHGAATMTVSSVEPMLTAIRLLTLRYLEAGHGERISAELRAHIKELEAELQQMDPRWFTTEFEPGRA